MNLEEMTLEEKVDLLIKYQIKAVRMARARMIGSIVLFFLLASLNLFFVVYHVELQRLFALSLCFFMFEILCCLLR